MATKHENRDHPEDDRVPHGQGRVKDPAHDGRLKENGGGQHGQGQVKDPKHDGRLKDHR
jgi:hypothetical protein